MSGKTFKRHSGAVKEFCKDAGKGLIQPEGRDAKEVQVESKHCGEDLLPGIAYLEADEKVTFEIHDHGGERVAGYVRAAEGLLKWQEASVEKMNTDECPMGVVSSLDKGYGKVRYKGHDNKVYHVFVYLADRENPVSGGADRPQALKRDERISFTLAPAGESQVEAQFIAAEWAITTADFEDPGENEADQSESTLMSELIRDFASKHCQDDKIDAKSFERFWQRLFNREFRKLHMVRQKMLDSAHEQLSGLKDGTITPRANFFAENRSSTVRTSQIRASNIKRQSSKDPHSPNNVLASAEGSSDNFNKGMSSCSDDGEEEELSPQQHAVKDVCRQIRAFTLCAPGEEERSTFIPTKVVSDLAVARLLGDLQDLSSPLSPTNSLKMRQSAMEEDPASNKRLAPMEGEKMGVDLFASKSPNAGVPQDRRSCTGATQHHIPELADADNTLRDFILELGPADEALKAVFEKATRHTTTGQGICESYIDFKLIVKEGTVAGNDTPLDDDHLKKCRTTLDKLKTAVDSVDADAAMNLPQNLIDAIDHLFARMDTEERLAIPKDDVQKMWGRIWGGNDKQITFVDGVTVIPKAFLYQQFNRELESMIEDEELDEDDDSVAEVIARIRVDDKIKEWFDFMDDNQSGTIEFEEERDFWRLFFETDEEAVAATKHTNGDNDSLTLEQLYLSFAAEKKDTGCNALLNKLDKMIMVATVYKKKMRSTDQHDSTVETWGLPQEVRQRS